MRATSRSVRSGGTPRWAGVPAQVERHTQPAATEDERASQDRHAQEQRPRRRPEPHDHEQHRQQEGREQGQRHESTVTAAGPCSAPRARPSAAQPMAAKQDQPGAHGRAGLDGGRIEPRRAARRVAERARSPQPARLPQRRSPGPRGWRPGPHPARDRPDSSGAKPGRRAAAGPRSARARTLGARTRRACLGAPARPRPAPAPATAPARSGTTPRSRSSHSLWSAPRTVSESAPAPRRDACRAPRTRRTARPRPAPAGPSTRTSATKNFSLGHGDRDVAVSGGEELEGHHGRVRRHRQAAGLEARGEVPRGGVARASRATCRTGWCPRRDPTPVRSASRSAASSPTMAVRPQM